MLALPLLRGSRPQLHLRTCGAGPGAEGRFDRQPPPGAALPCCVRRAFSGCPLLRGKQNRVSSEWPLYHLPLLRRKCS